MNFAFTEDQLALKEGMASFFAAEIPAERLRRLIEKNEGRSPELRAKIAEQGLFGLSIPEDAGGLGLSDIDWALMTRCSQPVTVGVWSMDREFDELNRIALDRSEVVSFHSYAPPGELQERINFLRFLADGRPMLCTEYMARRRGSTFQNCLPLLKANNVTAISWGLVAGKTNTIYPWNWSPEQGEPDQWFHDVFRPDGKLLYEEERKAFQAVNI